MRENSQNKGFFKGVSTYPPDPVREKYFSLKLLSKYSYNVLGLGRRGRLGMLENGKYRLQHYLYSIIFEWKPLFNS